MCSFVNDIDRGTPVVMCNRKTTLKSPFKNITSEMVRLKDQSEGYGFA